MTHTDPGLATVIDQHYAELAAGLPFTDFAREAWADRLEEQGQCDRAELVRVQCELATNPECKSTVNYPAGYICDRAWCKSCMLRRRERELLKGHWKDWYIRFPETRISPETGLKKVTKFRRGFPSILSGIRLADWIGGRCEQCCGLASATLELGNTEFDWTCPDCSGTGTIPGIGPRIAGAVPLERVEFCGKEARDSIDHDGKFYFNDREPDSAYGVQKDIGIYLTGEILFTDHRGCRWWYYDTREAALADLSRAAILFAHAAATCGRAAAAVG